MKRPEIKKIKKGIELKKSLPLGKHKYEKSDLNLK